MFIRFITLISALLLPQLNQAQAPDFLWAHGLGNSGHEEAQLIAADLSGNIVVAGFFEGMVDFDPSATSSTLTSSSSQDIFLMKMDGNGNLMWVRQFSSTGTSYAIDLEVDPSGNIFLLGSFTGTLDGDPGAAVLTLTNVKTMAFIIKLDDSGILSWAKQFEGTAEVFPSSIDVSYPGSVYIHGDISDGIAEFESGPGTFNLSTPSMWGFLCKLDASGNLVWAIFPSQIPNWFGEIAVDANDNVLITGRFVGTIDFDPGPAVNTQSATSFDVYLQKLDGAGNFEFVKSFGGPNTETGFKIDTDGDGNILLEGLFADSADFDPGPGVFQMKSLGGDDIFYIKLNNIGDFLWAGTLGTTLNDAPVYSSFDNQGNIYLVNLIWTTMDLNPNVSAGNMFSTMGSNDGFIVKLDSAGNYQWVKFIGDSGWDVLYQICFDSANNIYLAGYFNSPTIDFSSIQVANYLTTPPSYNLFVAKLESTTSGLPNMQLAAVNMFPNPANDFLNVEFPQQYSGTISISDMLGRIVFNSTLQNETIYKVNISALPAGIYSIQLENDVSVFSEKVLVW